MTRFEKFNTWLAWRLPKELTYWSFIRVMAHASGNEFSHRHPDSITFSEAARAWFSDPTTSTSTPSLEPAEPSKDTD